MGTASGKKPLLGCFSLRALQSLGRHTRCCREQRNRQEGHVEPGTFPATRGPAQASPGHGGLGKRHKKGGEEPDPSRGRPIPPRAWTKHEAPGAEDRARDPREEERAPADGGCEGRAAGRALTPPQKDPRSQGTMPQLPRDRGEDGDKDELGAGGERSPTKAP